MSREAQFVRARRIISQRAIRPGHRQSRRSTNWTPLTTRPSLTSRQGIRTGLQHGLAHTFSTGRAFGAGSGATARQQPRKASRQATFVRFRGAPSRRKCPSIRRNGKARIRWRRPLRTLHQSMLSSVIDTPEHVLRDEAGDFSRRALSITARRHQPAVQRLTLASTPGSSRATTRADILRFFTHRHGQAGIPLPGGDDGGAPPGKQRMPDPAVGPLPGHVCGASCRIRQ